MLHDSVSRQTLGFARIWVFALWFRRIYADPFPQLYEVPLEIFERIGVLRLVPEALYDHLWTAPMLWTLKGGLLVGLGLLILGVGPYRRIAVVTCVLLTFHQGLIRGFGFINHSELGMLYAAYVLAVFPAADGLSLRRRKVVYAPPVMYAVPMMAIAFIFAMAYAFVGIRRVAASSPGIFLDGSILHYVMRNATLGGAPGVEHKFSMLREPWLALMLQIGFPLITLFEVLTPLCLISRPLRWVWMGVMVPFHVLARVLLNVDFRYNLLLLVVFFTDIERLAGGVRQAYRKWVTPWRSRLSA